MDPKTLGERVRQARDALKITQEQLANLLDIPRSAVSDMERGHRGVTASELLALSRHLRRTLEYFVADEPESALGNGAFQVRFRAQELGDSDADAVFQFEQRCRDYLWLEHELDVPSFNLRLSYHMPQPDSIALARKQGEELASQERGRLGLGQGPVQDPFAIVESQGVRLIFMRLDTPRVSGIVHRTANHGAFLLVNTAFHWHRRSFDLLHEYCHLLVDDFSGVHLSDENLDSDRLIERRADAFAAAFLLPKEGVASFLVAREVQDGPLLFSDVLRVMVVFGASYQATLYRLHELGYLDVHRFTAFKGAKNIEDMAFKMRRAEGLKETEFDNPAARRFGQLVLRAYVHDKISIGRVSELLDIDLLDAKELAWLWQAGAPSQLDMVSR